MEETTKLIVERFETLANADVAEFRRYFRSLRKLFPQQAAEACLAYLAQHGVDLAAHSIVFWFGGDKSYIPVLFSAEGLPPETAFKAVTVIKDIDPQFMLRFNDSVLKLESPAAIQRALSLVPAVGDYKILLPWLRKLCEHPDTHIRSRAAKLHVECRPSKGLVARHLSAEDPRVRANAVEALAGHSQDVEEARTLFRSAVQDPHHRVVANALVGLYAMGEPGVLHQMIEFSTREDHLFRAAMAWAMGFVKDPRAIPRLKQMTSDCSAVVRKRALHSLLIIETLATSIATQGDTPTANLVPAA